MHLPSHITAKKKDTKKNKKSEREKNKSTRPDVNEKKSDRTQASSQPKTDDKNSYRKEPNTNTSNPAYPGNKKKNSDGYGGYGYKKSANSTASQSKNSQCVVNAQLILEDKMLTKEFSKKSFVSILSWFIITTNMLIALIFTYFILNVYVHPQHPALTISFGIGLHNIRLSFTVGQLDFTATSVSTTHYSVAILTDDLDVSKLIREIPMDLSRPETVQRESAFLFTFLVKYVFEHSPDGLLANASLGNGVSHLSWGFNQDVGEMKPGPLIIHNENIFNNEFERAMSFPELKNTSWMSRPLDLKKFSDEKLQVREAQDKNIENLTAAFSKIIPIRNIKLKTTVFGEYFMDFAPFPRNKYTAGNRKLPLSNLTVYDTEEFGLLQFASSGPKTLGTIAEIAIQMSLEALVNHDSMSDIEYVDKVVAQALIHTLDAVALHDGYFEKLVLNKTAVMKEVREKLKDPENLEKHNTSSSIVQFETSGALTSNLLILDNRDGWPSVFHYSVSAPGPFVLRALGKNSTEMVNSCQVIVIKDGYLWLTAAASGEFYLLEKVVASIVHKIIRNADPLMAIVQRQRLRYDTHKRTIVTDKWMSASDYPIEPMVEDVSALSSGDEGEYDGEDDQQQTPVKEELSPHRESLSESNLPAKTPDSAATFTVGKGTSRYMPFQATMKEIEDLKNQLQMCRAELDVSLYKEREARSLLTRDHYKLQLDSLETQKKLQQFDELQTILNQVVSQRDEALHHLSEHQRATENDIECYEKQIDELTKQLDTARSQGAIAYQDFTLASSIADPELLDAQQKMTDAQEENAQLLAINSQLQKEVQQLTNSLEAQMRSTADKTSFIIGNTEREQELLSKIDSLESDFKQKEDSMLGVIQTLLQAESALKKKVERYKTDVSLTETQLSFSDGNQLLELVNRLENQLLKLREDNRAMRLECARIKGVELEESKESLADTQPSETAQNLELDVTGGPSEIDGLLNQIRNVNQHLKTEYGLDLNVSRAEQLEIGGILPNNVSTSFSGRPRISFADGRGLATANDVSISGINASFADVLQVSISASEDVRLVKIKLETLKELLVSMFERLRGSAFVLDEVYKYLSNGSPDNREIAEKIRRMRFEFSAMTCKDSAVEKAVNESMVQLQTSLCVFEQSLNQTASFILETTRRYSIAPNQSHLQQANVICSNDAAEYERVIVELQEKLAMGEASLDEMKSLVTTTKVKLAEVTDARDEALASVDSLRAKVAHYIQEIAEHKAVKLECDAALQASLTSEESLTKEIRGLEETCEVLKMRVETLEIGLQNSKKDLETTEERSQMQQHEIHEIKLSRSDLSQKFTSIQDELEKTKVLLNERMMACEELRVSNKKFMESLGQMELENRNLVSKCTDYETAATKKERAMSAEKERLIEESSAAKETMSMLGLRVAELENALDGYESRDVRLSRTPNGQFELSCIERATNVHKKTMTDLTGELIDDVIGETASKSKDLERLQAVYNQLATAIYAYVAACSPPSHIYNSEIEAVESVGKELIDLLKEAQQKNTMALEQLDIILAKQKNASSSESQSIALKYKHQETPIDELKYNTKLRQDFYWLTSLSADLTQNIKNAETILRPQNKVNLTRIVDDSRRIRNGLNDRLALVTRMDKENVIPQTMNELVDMNTLLRSQNNDLHLTLKENKAKMEAFKNEVSMQNGAPELLSKIKGEIAKIEKVMSTACEGIRKVPRN